MKIIRKKIDPKTIISLTTVLFAATIAIYYLVKEPVKAVIVLGVVFLASFFSFIMDKREFRKQLNDHLE